MEAKKLEEKFPRIVVTKISNGFLVTVIPQDKELQKVMQNYVKDIMNSIQNIADGGDEWKQKMQDGIDRALKAESNDNIKMYARNANPKILFFDLLSCISLNSPSVPTLPNRL